MGKILQGVMQAISRALRRTVMRFRDGVLVPTIEWVDGFLAGLFSGGQPQVTEEHVEETDVEDAARARIDQVLDRPPVRPSMSLGAIAKAAAGCRENGRPPVGLYDDLDPVHRHLRSWVDSLGETGLRTLRHMPVDTIDRHLDHRNTWQAGGGLPRFDPAPISLTEETSPAPMPSFERRRRRLRDERTTDRRPSAEDAIDAYRSMRSASI